MRALTMFSIATRAWPALVYQETRYFTGMGLRHRGGFIMTEQRAHDQEGRLRAHPVERFAGPSHMFDLGAALRELRAEAPPTQRGHRQITILKHMAVTQLLFSFEPGSELKDHVAHGLVTIHVLEGRLSVQVDGRDHDLSAGYVLILNPDVAHDVRAAETSAML